MLPEGAFEQQMLPLWGDPRCCVHFQIGYLERIGLGSILETEDQFLELGKRILDLLLELSEDLDEQ